MAWKWRWGWDRHRTNSQPTPHKETRKEEEGRGCGCWGEASSGFCCPRLSAGGKMEEGESESPNSLSSPSQLGAQLYSLLWA